MNKTLIVAAVSVLTAGSALAQSSVTLYGRINTSAERQDKNGVKTYQLVNNASRFGFKGTEDLGGGLKAGFVLESGFNSDTGASTGPTFFGRQAEVNLAGAFGMVRLGTMTSEAYYATADYISMHNHDTGPSADALYAYVTRYPGANKVSYRLPEFVKGLSIEGGVLAGEGTTTTAGNPGISPVLYPATASAVNKRAYDLAINYAIGKFAFGLGAEKNDRKEQVAIRALGEFGPFILGAYYQRDKNGFAPLASLNNYGTRNSVRVSGAYIFGNNELHLNVGHADDYSKIANSAANQATIAYNYNLSKRTKVYTYYTRLEDSGANLYNSANYGIAYTGRKTDFSSLAFGVRHNF